MSPGVFAAIGAAAGLLLGLMVGLNAAPRSYAEPKRLDTMACEIGSRAAAGWIGERLFGDEEPTE